MHYLLRAGRTILCGEGSDRVEIRKNLAQSAGGRCRLVHHTAGAVKARCEAKEACFRR